MSDLIPPIITGGALVVVNGVIIAIQGWRRRRDQLDREKEETLELFRDKAEQLFMAIKRVLIHLEKPALYIVPADSQVVYEAVGEAKVDLNLVQMLLNYYFPFFDGMKNDPGEVLNELYEEINDYAEAAQKYPRQYIDWMGASQSELSKAYEKLRNSFKSCDERLTVFLLELPDKDLYRLQTEWQKKRKGGKTQPK